MLYLSDAIRGEYVQDEFNVVEAPCGCGKTEYAVNKLPYEILGSKPQFNRVLYLIDTCAGRHSIVAKHPEKARCYDNIIDNGGRRFDGFDANRIVVITYTLSLRRQKPQKRKNRVGFQIVLQNVNEVQTMGLLLWYNNSRKRRENVKMKIAYVRVSTVEQNEARQIEALKKYDVDKWFTEKVSAKDTNRPQLQAMIDFAREGDTIYIHDFSRLARSTADLLKLVEQLQAKGVHLVSNKENIDTSTPTGRLMLTMIGAINEFERCNLLERQREGIAIAKAQGKFKGRKEVKADDFAAQYQRYLNRELNKAQLAKTLGISRPTLDKLIRQHTTA